MSLKKYFTSPTTLEAGVDEAGRGPLVGAVYAAAVILPTGWEHPLLDDSKKMKAGDRDALREIIHREALAWSVAWVEARVIDEINILQATFRAMNLAVEGLRITPQVLLIDGNRFSTQLDIPYHTIVKGDSLYTSIAAASVLAKSHRDEYMRGLDELHPQYNWAKNSGYPTKSHLDAIEKYGLTEHHRLSFRNPLNTK